MPAVALPDLPSDLIGVAIRTVVVYVFLLETDGTISVIPKSGPETRTTRSVRQPRMPGG